MYKLYDNNLIIDKDFKIISKLKNKQVITYHNEIRTIKNDVFKSKIILSYKKDYEQYLINNGKTKYDEYIFNIKYI
jgi:hypothetical protein